MRVSNEYKIERHNFLRSSRIADISYSGCRYSRVKKKFLLLSFGSWLVYLAFLAPGVFSIDGWSMLMVADSIVTRHDLTVPAALGVPGRNGLIYSIWYPLQSILAVPVVALAVKVSALSHVPLHYVEGLAALILPALYTALTVPLVYFLAIGLQASEDRAWLAAVTYGFGTIAMTYTRDFYADPLLALLMALGLVLAFTRRAPWKILCVAALAILAKPTGIILGPILSAYLYFKTRRFWPSVMPALGTALGALVYSAYNFYRFGHLRSFGQGWDFSISFIPEGLAGLLISPGGGLLWFCPCVILSFLALAKLRGRHLEAWTIAALAASSLLLHSLWIAWSGGWSWGPRLLLPVLPGLVALASTLKWGGRKLLLSAAMIGFLLNAPTMFSSFKRYFSEAGEQGIPASSLMWEPSRSPLLHAWPAAFRQVQDARHLDVRDLVAQRGELPATKISNSRALRVVAVWWWLLPILHVSRVWGVLASALLIALGATFVFLARPPLVSQISGNVPPATAT